MPQRHLYIVRYGNALRQKEGRPYSSSTTRRWGLAKQCFGSGAVRARLVAMGNGAHDFQFEQANAFVQLVMRIGVERFGCQLAGQIPFRARALIYVH